MNKKEELINYFFLQVEQNNLYEIKKIFEKFPSLKEDPRNLKANNGWSPDLFAARFGYTDMLKYFLEEIYPNQLNRKLLDLILLNIHSGSLRSVYYLNDITEIKHEDLHHFFSNSCKLDKNNLCLYFLL